MGIDDFCHTALVLGLGLSSSSSTRGNHRSKVPPSGYKFNRLSRISEPSLTLSLCGSESSDRKSEIDFRSSGGDINLYGGQDHSVASSLISNVSVKREREMGGGEVEMERVSARVGDEDDDYDGSNGRKKLRLTKAQSALLEESFKQHTTLNPKQKKELAKDVKLRPRQVEVWFQNRRARTKLKQTEVDCEFLKKCCEKLTEENRRLQKELHELKLAKPLYMQLPAATITICPSCERIAAAPAEENTPKRPFNMAPKAHFYNPFTNHPSAAC